MSTTDTASIGAIGAAARERGALAMWTIFDHPSDFPDCFVARCFEAGRGGAVATAHVITGPLGAMRASLEACGLTCLTRSPLDDPSIVETWL